MKQKILIVEDNIILSQQQKKWFEKFGYDVTTTIDEPSARKQIEKGNFDLVLSDVRLPAGDGIALLEWIKKKNMDIPFIVMTGYASVPEAVKAIRLGAKNYLVKPVDMEDLLELMKELLYPLSIVHRQEKRLLRRRSPSAIEVEHLIETVAPFDISVLILGENGTGKESVAQSIHRHSDRKDMPFVAVNCGVMPRELAASLFFGHEKGSFTGADSNKIGYFDMAKGGTLFLDEIGTLSIEVQAMLLRVLQEGTYISIGSHKEKKADVRIVAATNEDMQLAIKEKRFREDLFHRLNEFEIYMPPLRECPEDIIPLAEHFRERFSKELKKMTTGFSKDAEQLLLSYKWPGNIRELQNKIKRTVLLAKGILIEKDELNIKIINDSHEDINLFPENEVEEKISIIKALKASGGHRKKAAELLHINPATLYRKMNKYGLK